MHEFIGERSFTTDSSYYTLYWPYTVRRLDIFFHSIRLGTSFFKSNSTFHVDTQLYILSGGLLSIRFNSRYLWVLIRILCLLCPVGLFVSHPSPVRSNCLEMPTIINRNSRSGNNNEYWRETCWMCFTTIRIIRLRVENKTYYMI